MSDYELSAVEFRALYDRVKHWRGRAVSLAAPIESEVAAASPFSEPAGRPPGRLGRSTAWTDTTT
jgi:hypothetical protein